MLHSPTNYWWLKNTLLSYNIKEMKRNILKIAILFHYRIDVPLPTLNLQQIRDNSQTQMQILISECVKQSIIVLWSRKSHWFFAKIWTHISKIHHQIAAYIPKETRKFQFIKNCCTKPNTWEKWLWMWDLNPK